MVLPILLKPGTGLPHLTQSGDAVSMTASSRSQIFAILTAVWSKGFECPVLSECSRNESSGNSKPQLHLTLTPKREPRVPPAGRPEGSPCILSPGGSC